MESAAELHAFASYVLHGSGSSGGASSRKAGSKPSSRSGQHGTGGTAWQRLQARYRFVVAQPQPGSGSPPPPSSGSLTWADVCEAVLPASASESVVCPICLEHPAGAAPRLTACGHVFCAGCFLGCVAAAREAGSGASHGPWPGPLPPLVKPGGWPRGALQCPVCSEWLDAHDTRILTMTPAASLSLSPDVCVGSAVAPKRLGTVVGGTVAEEKEAPVGPPLATSLATLLSRIDASPSGGPDASSLSLLLAPQGPHRWGPGISAAWVPRSAAAATVVNTTGRGDAPAVAAPPPQQHLAAFRLVALVTRGGTGPKGDAGPPLPPSLLCSASVAAAQGALLIDTLRPPDADAPEARFSCLLTAPRARLRATLQRHLAELLRAAAEAQADADEASAAANAVIGAILHVPNAAAMPRPRSSPASPALPASALSPPAPALALDQPPAATGPAATAWGNRQSVASLVRTMGAVVPQHPSQQQQTAFPALGRGAPATRPPAPAAATPAFGPPCPTAPPQSSAAPDPVTAAGIRVGAGTGVPWSWLSGAQSELVHRLADTACLALKRKALLELGVAATRAELVAVMGEAASPEGAPVAATAAPAAAPPGVGEQGQHDPDPGRECVLAYQSLCGEAVFLQPHCTELLLLQPRIAREGGLTRPPDHHGAWDWTRGPPQVLVAPLVELETGRVVTPDVMARGVLTRLHFAHLPVGSKMGWAEVELVPRFRAPASGSPSSPSGDPAPGPVAVAWGGAEAPSPPPRDAHLSSAAARSATPSAAVAAASSSSATGATSGAAGTPSELFFPMCSPPPSGPWMPLHASSTTPAGSPAVSAAVPSPPYSTGHPLQLHPPLQPLLLFTTCGEDARSAHGSTLRSLLAHTARRAALRREAVAASAAARAAVPLVGRTPGPRPSRHGAVGQPGPTGSSSLLQHILQQQQPPATSANARSAGWSAPGGRKSNRLQGGAAGAAGGAPPQRRAAPSTSATSVGSLPSSGSDSGGAAGGAAPVDDATMIPPLPVDAPDGDLSLGSSAATAAAAQRQRGGSDTTDGVERREGVLPSLAGAFLPVELAACLLDSAIVSVATGIASSASSVQRRSSVPGDAPVESAVESTDTPPPPSVSSSSSGGNGCGDARVALLPAAAAVAPLPQPLTAAAPAFVPRLPAPTADTAASAAPHPSSTTACPMALAAQQGPIGPGPLAAQQGPVGPSPLAAPTSSKLSRTRGELMREVMGISSETGTAAGDAALAAMLRHRDANAAAPVTSSQLRDSSLFPELLPGGRPASAVSSGGRQAPLGGSSTASAERPTAVVAGRSGGAPVVGVPLSAVAAAAARSSGGPSPAVAGWSAITASNGYFPALAPASPQRPTTRQLQPTLKHQQQRATAAAAAGAGVGAQEEEGEDSAQQLQARYSAPLQASLNLSSLISRSGGARGPRGTGAAGGPGTGKFQSKGR